MTLAPTAVAIHPFKRVINHVVELIVAGCHFVQQSTQCVLLPLIEVICLHWHHCSMWLLLLCDCEI